MAADSSARVLMKDIHKRFGGVHALRGASIEVAPGSIHALVGENGAGKSTLIKMLSGVVHPDSGQILLDGEIVDINSPLEAMALGIATVYQDPQLVPELSVTENIFLGREVVRGVGIDWKTEFDQAKEILSLVGFPTDQAISKVADLSIAEQQQVAIAKAIAEDARVLILDEPSAILTDAEIKRLFDIVRRLASTGVSIIFITHRLDEVFDLTDRITVLRDGHEVAALDTADASLSEVIQWMVGDVESERRVAQKEFGSTVLEAENIGFAQEGPWNSLSVKSGEIVGLYGLLGSGTFEFVDACYGIRPTWGGSIKIDGKDAHIASPVDAKHSGINMVPADRGKQALFSFQSILFNISVQELRAISRRGIIQSKEEMSTVQSLIKRLSIRTPSPQQPVSAMSGGNAQKVVFARQMVKTPRLLLLAEPTQGVDVGAKEEIHRLIESMAAEGAGILMATTDLAELVRLCDRVLVFRDGEIAAEYPNGFNQVDLLSAAAGVTTSEEGND